MPSMPLEEALAVDPLGRADDRAGPALDVRRASRRRPPRNIARGPAWSPASAVAAVRPQGLVGLETETPITATGPLAVTVASPGPSCSEPGSAKSASCTGAGVSASTSAAGLSSRNPLNEAWRIAAVAGEAGDTRSRRPVRASPSARRPSPRRAPCRRTASLSVSSAFSAAGFADLVAAEARADPADIARACRRDTRRRSASGRPLPVVVQPPITTSCPARHFDLDQLPRPRPSGRARRAPWRPCLPGPSGRPTAGPRRRRSRSARHSGCAAPAALDQRLQPRLALAQRQAAQVLAPREHQVEDEEDQVVGLALADRRLQRREVGRAGVVQRHHLAVDQAVGQAGAGR